MLRLSGSRVTSGWFSALGDRGGNVAVVFALGIVPLVAAAGAALDYSRVTSVRTRLQTAADGAALAGARLAAATVSERRVTAEKSLKMMAPGVGTMDVDVVEPTVTVRASEMVATTLMQLVGVRSVRVDAVSRARWGGDRTCILLLETTENALEINSHSALSADCGVHVNSSNAEAVFLNSDSRLDAESICIVGGIRVNSGGGATPTPRTGCALMADPLASLPEPVERNSSCDHSSLVVNSGETRTLKPGVYCDLLEINSGSTAYLDPGLYVIRNGELKVNSHSSVIGKGVMIFLQGKTGRLNVNSDSRIDLSAPSTGTYKGIIVFQSRDPITYESDYQIINSDSQTRLEGTIYVPNGQVMLNSDATSNSMAAYTVMVARRLVLNSYGTFVADDEYAEGTPLPDLLGRLGNRDIALIE